MKVDGGPSSGTLINMHHYSCCMKNAIAALICTRHILLSSIKPLLDLESETNEKPRIPSTLQVKSYNGTSPTPSCLG